MIMDKTGTLTDGRMSVVEVFTKIAPTQLWQIVDSLEASSTHPIATSLRTHARKSEFIRETATKVHTVGGSGVQGIVAGHPCALGSPKWLGTPEGEFSQAVERFQARGDSVVIVYRDSQAIAVIALADALDPSAIPALAHLQKLKITNIKVLIDCNGSSERAIPIINILKNLKTSFKDLDFIIVDGHSTDALISAMSTVKKSQILLCETIKGYPISFMKDNFEWHHRIPNKNEILKIKEELK
jgi:hypothetical protein